MEDAGQLAHVNFNAKTMAHHLTQAVEPLPHRQDVLQEPSSHRGYPTIFPVCMSRCASSNDCEQSAVPSNCGQDVGSKLRQELEQAHQRICQLQVEKLEVCKELERKEQLLEEARDREEKLREQSRARSKGGELQKTVANASQVVAELLRQAEVHEVGLQERLGLKDQLAMAAEDTTKKASSTMSTLLKQASSELAAERQHRKCMQEKLAALQAQLASLQQLQCSEVLAIEEAGRSADASNNEDDDDAVEDNVGAEGSQVYPAVGADLPGSGLLDSDAWSGSGLKGEVVYHTNAFAQLEDACQELPLQDTSDTDDEDFWERDAALHAQLLDLSQMSSTSNTPRGSDSSKENIRLSNGHFQSLTELLGMAKAVDMRLSANTNPWAHAPLTSRGRPVRPHKSMRDFAGINISNIVSNNNLLAAAQQLSARSWTAGEGMKPSSEPTINGVPSPRSARSNTSSSDSSQDDSTASNGSKGAAAQDGSQDARRELEEKRLLSLLPNPMGFSNGRPLAALAVFYSCLRWKTFQTGRGTLLDAIMQIISNMIDQHQADNTKLAYWLTNTATLWHLLHKSMKPMGAAQWAKSAAAGKPAGGATGISTQYRVEATYPTLVFKQQLDALVQKIFPLICANVKSQISSQLSSTAQAQAEKLKQATGSLPWTQMLQALDELLSTLKEQYVPKGVARALFKQLFSYVNVQQFNQLLLRRDCCSFSNGECIKSGLLQLDEWVHRAGADWVANAQQDLDHIRQAVEFMVLSDKPSLNLADISSRLCPALSINQLYRLATMFWDDRMSTGSLSTEVLQQMKRQLVSGQSGSHAFLLDADSMLTVAVEDVLKMLDDKDFQFPGAPAAQQAPMAAAPSQQQVSQPPALHCT